MGLEESDNSIDEENNNLNYTLSYCVLYYFQLCMILHILMFISLHVNKN